VDTTETPKELTYS